ncbi:MAG: diaminopimelate decarboxylase [Hydrogenoanaerobacterium sp.]
MFVSECLNINSEGHLTIGGLSTVTLAAKHGTPLYVMDEDSIRANCRSFKSSIEESYEGGGTVAFASKAFCCKAICKIVMEEGLGLDVVSAGELYTAISIGFPPEKIYFHDNNKTPNELSDALQYGVGRIVVDNLTELEVLSRIALAIDGKTANILLRIKPGIDAHTHDFVRTGQIDSKFGFALETGEAMFAVKKALCTQNICLKGVHCHIGSQILDVEPFELAAETMLSFLADVKKSTCVELGELNLGGGFGIKYLPQTAFVPYGSYMSRVSAVVHKKCDELGLALPHIIIEPGRAIVGCEGITLYTIGAVKHIPNIRTYVSVDGGMADNPRYALYKSEYQAIIANKANKICNTKVTVAGKCCESGDLLGEGMMIQEPSPGDILAVLSTGAYNYSMASNYNRLPKPAVVMVCGGKERIVVKRQSFDELLQDDLL